MLTFYTNLGAGTKHVIAVLKIGVEKSKATYSSYQEYNAASKI